MLKIGTKVLILRGKYPTRWDGLYGIVEGADAVTVAAPFERFIRYDVRLTDGSIISARDSQLRVIKGA